MSSTTPYGNFHNYYAFNKPENRTAYLAASPALLHLTQSAAARISASNPLRILDVGCNAGDISVAVHRLLCERPFSLPHDAVRVVGADLDPELIERGKELHTVNTQCSFHATDIMNSDSLDGLPYRTFDLALVFSITMWIHVNHGDDGLDTFLRRLCSVASALLIEPQPWKCYRNLRARRRKAGLDPPVLLDSLCHRTDVCEHIHQVILGEGFDLAEEMGVTKWGRSIRLYVRQAADRKHTPQ